MDVYRTHLPVCLLELTEDPRQGQQPDERTSLFNLLNRRTNSIMYQL